MSKFKISYTDLETITSGKTCLAINGLDTSGSKEIAIACFPKYFIAFNPDNSLQVQSIIRGNPTFDGFIDVDESNAKKYTWHEIRKWMPDVTTPKLYIPKYKF